jgi:hypothetical protein
LFNLFEIDWCATQQNRTFFCRQGYPAEYASHTGNKYGDNRKHMDGHITHANAYLQRNQQHWGHQNDDLKQNVQNQLGLSGNGTPLLDKKESNAVVRLRL